MESELGNIFLQIEWADKFLKATECNLISGLLGILFFGAIIVIIKQYKRNTALSSHIMEADKNNAVLMVELNANLDKIYKADETNADKIITEIKHLK